MITVLDDDGIEAMVAFMIRTISARYAGGLISMVDAKTHEKQVENWAGLLRSRMFRGDRGPS